MFDRPKQDPCAALIVQGRHNNGIILECRPNCQLDWEVREIGTVYLGDFGLDLAPPGLSVWEGVGIWRPGGYECPQDGQFDYEGEFRRPTVDELAKIAAGERLWPEPPEEKDVDEDEGTEE